MKTLLPITLLFFFFVGIVQTSQAKPTIILNGTLRQELYRPIRVAVDNSGAIAVADYHRKRIYLFNEDHELTSSFPVPSPPLSLSFAQDGSLYVGISNDILRVSTTGMIGGRFSEQGFQVNAPVGLAVSNTGLVYIIEREKQCVLVCSSSGDSLYTFGGHGTQNGQFNLPSGITINRSTNEIVVADGGNSRVQIFSEQGEYLRSFGKHIEKIDTVWEYEGSFAQMQGVAVDSSGRIYVTDSGLNLVQIFDAQGNHLGFLGNEGHPSNHLRVPMGIAISKDRKLFVTSLTASEVLEYQIMNPTNVLSSDEPLPINYLLEQNYPNPFNPATSIRFSQPKEEHIQLRIFDVTGRLITTLVDEHLNAGVHALEWDGTDGAGTPVASGIYLCRLRAGDTFMQTNKMLLLR